MAFRRFSRVRRRRFVRRFGRRRRTIKNTSNQARSQRKKQSKSSTSKPKRQAKFSGQSRSTQGAGQKGKRVVKSNFSSQKTKKKQTKNRQTDQEKAFQNKENNQKTENKVLHSWYLPLQVQFVTFFLFGPVFTTPQPVFGCLPIQQYCTSIRIQVLSSTG
jgi:hypothetical protein